MLTPREEAVIDGILLKRQMIGRSTIGEMKTLISLYIKDRKGASVSIGDIRPIDKFEKACTVAYNYYVGVE